MGYLNRVWMAATVAVVQGHTDHGINSSQLRSLHRAGDRLASAAAAATGLGIGRALGGAGAEERRKQADDSLRQVIAKDAELDAWPGRTRQVKRNGPRHHLTKDMSLSCRTRSPFLLLPLATTNRSLPPISTHTTPPTEEEEAGKATESNQWVSRDGGAHLRFTIYSYCSSRHVKSRDAGGNHQPQPSKRAGP
ncbi:hypothetical protein GW17_00061524, partial [Ensete ventricosum]